MKTKILQTTFLLIIFSSCIQPKFLPKPDQIDVYEYGSYIELKHKGSVYSKKGELIAIDSNNIVVLDGITQKCETYSLDNVKKFRLRYAQGKNYGWSIPLVLALPLINGVLSGFTIPFHLIVTISVTAAGDKAFTYSQRDMTFEKLKKFARFPQGIPQGIDLAEIKANDYYRR